MGPLRQPAALRRLRRLGARHLLHDPGAARDHGAAAPRQRVGVHGLRRLVVRVALPDPLGGVQPESVRNFNVSGEAKVYGSSLYELTEEETVRWGYLGLDKGCKMGVSGLNAGKVD